MKLKLPLGTVLNFRDAPAGDPLNGLDTEPVFLPGAFPGASEERVTQIEKAVAAAMDARAQRLEMFAAAFVKEVGSTEASKYELVEEWAPGRVKWSYRLRK